MDRLFELVYGELRRIADRQMSNERDAHTLSPTALANEAYLKMIDQSQAEVEGRTQFLSMAATAMRRLLVDHARTKRRLKRGGDRQQVEFEDQIALTDHGELVDILSLEEALTKLAERNARQAQVAELRLFAGLSIDDIAAALEVSARTVDGDWAIGRAWLRRELASDASK